MKNWDPNDPVDPQEWLAELELWRDNQRAARDAQAAARRRFDAAEGAVSTLQGWAAGLAAAIDTTSAHAGRIDVLAADLASTDASIATLSDEIHDYDEARAIATARVLAGPSTAMPIVLLPVRLQTSWQGATLTVRIYPDALSVDSHDRRLSTDERSAGEAYWSMRRAAGEADADQAWANLVRRTSAQRAAWIARATDPTAPVPAAKDSEWETSVVVRLLPDRFAVVAYAAGEPVNLAPSSEPPRYVAWGRPLPQRLAIDGLADADAATWMTDPAGALEIGMAVRITVPDGAPRIDQLLVIGLRSGPDSSAAELADLLDAHAFTDGLEIMADGSPTNNSEQIRATHSPRRDSELALRLVDPARPSQLADGSAGAQLAEALGIPRARVAAIGGATADRRAAADAARLLVAIAAHGALGDLLGADARAAWPLLMPAGPVPVLRAGRQPYGILPTSAPSRWQPAADELSEPLAPVVQRWGRAHAAAVDLDPGDPPSAPPPTRRVTRDDDSALPDVLLETASSLTWSDGHTVYSGLEGLVGPPDGAHAASSYLNALADARDSELDAIAATLPPALLARLAVAARRRASGGERERLVAALRLLADHAARDGGRRQLAVMATQHLDALSHRADAWLTAASWERLRVQRRAAPVGRFAVGAYGFLSDVEPRTRPRSHGHVHAPSLGHAATAAVLRSGYLGQRRAAWAARVARARAALAAEPASAAARRALDEAEAGLAQLHPLDAEAERSLPLAVDISSRRVRQARWVLSAVRGGQPLGAVLGYQFERDLADSGLQRYLAAFRKLTRFSTGTLLEFLENARREARDQLAAAHAKHAELSAAVAAAAPAIETASTAHAKARDAERAAREATAPYEAMERELAALDSPAGIAKLEAALAAIDARRPEPTVERRRIETPDVPRRP